MLPHIVFHRSNTYDDVLAPMRTPGLRQPREHLIRSRLDHLRARWEPLSRPVLGELARVTKLQWEKPEITCYVTYGVTPFSDPLTLSINTSVDKLIDILIHELIHVLFSQDNNPPWFERNWDTLKTKYRTESEQTFTHILVQAVHEHILVRLFDEARLRKEIRTSEADWAIRAWHIIQRDGYRKIIRELTEGAQGEKAHKRAG